MSEEEKEEELLLLTVLCCCVQDVRIKKVNLFEVGVELGENSFVIQFELSSGSEASFVLCCLASFHVAFSLHDKFVMFYKCTWHLCGELRN